VKGVLSWVFFKKWGEWVCERNFNSYVWSVVHGSKCVQTKKHGRNLCVTNNCNGVHKMMNKPLDFLLKYLFLLNPLLDLSQTSNTFSLEGVERSFKFSPSLGLLQGNYICRK
jgi:hypothetical protein